MSTNYKIYKGKLFKVEQSASFSYRSDSIIDVFKANENKYPGKKLVVTNSHWWGYNPTRWVGNFKVQGEVMSAAYGSALGFGWSGNSEPMLLWSDMTAFENFISTIPAIQNGEILTAELDKHGYSTAIGVGRKAERTWFGKTSDGSWIVACNNNDQTLKEVVAEMKELGIIDGMVCDGSGSAKLYDGETYLDGNGMPSRWVYGFLLFWFDDPTLEEEPFKVGIYANSNNENKDLPAEIDYSETEFTKSLAEKTKYLLGFNNIECEIYYENAVNVANHDNVDLFIEIGTTTHGLSSILDDTDSEGITVSTYGSGDTVTRNVIAKLVLDLAKGLKVNIERDLFYAPSNPSLANTNMPAISIVCGTANNLEDAKRLNDNGYRDTLATMISIAISTYRHIDYKHDSSIEDIYPPKDAIVIPSDTNLIADWRWAVENSFFDGMTPDEELTKAEFSRVIRLAIDEVLYQVKGMLPKDEVGEPDIPDQIEPSDPEAEEETESTPEEEKEPINNPEPPTYSWEAEKAEILKWAVDNKIIQGDGNGNLDLEGMCTREVFLVLLHRALKVENLI